MLERDLDRDTRAVGDVSWVTNPYEEYSHIRDIPCINGEHTIMLLLGNNSNPMAIRTAPRVPFKLCTAVVVS